MFIRISLIAAVIFATTLTAQADFVWTPEEGLQAQGGLAEEFLGPTLRVDGPQDAMEIAKKEYQAKRYRNALSLYKKVYIDYPRSKYAPEARYEAARIYTIRRQYEEAFNTLEKIITDYPNYNRFNDVIAIEFEIASKLQAGKRPYYWGIIPGFRDYGKAIDFFESIVRNAPYTKYAPMALMNIADLAKEHKKTEDVVDALERLVSYYKDSEFAPEATLKLAQAHMDAVVGSERDQGATKMAITYYEDFLAFYPDHSLLPKAEAGLFEARNKLARSKLKVGDFYYQSRNNPKAASIFYHETISIAPESAAAKKARKTLDRIESGQLARKTPVDYIFGRYKPLSTPAYLDEMEMADRDNVEFDTITENVTFGLEEEDRLEDFNIEDTDALVEEEERTFTQPLKQEELIEELLPLQS